MPMHTRLSTVHLALILFFVCSLVGQNPLAQERYRYVDLNAPGAFERLKAKNVQHYEKVQAILEGLGQRNSRDVATWLQTSFKATDILYDDILLVTSPPQKDLMFVLDKVRYRARVTLERGGAKVYPVRNQ